MSHHVLIIGGGAIADSTHIPAAKALVGVDNVILAELNPTQKEKLAAKHGLVHTVSDYHEALPQCDACVICTPPHVRNAILKDCIAAGKHVLCEKPLSPSSADTKAILSSAPENLVIGMCHTYRFYPSRKELRRMIQSGFFGDTPVVTINEGMPSNWPTVSGYCFKKELVPGGALYDNGIHTLDFLIWCFGKPKEVVYEDDAMGGLESNLTIHFQFEKAQVIYKLSRSRDLSNSIVVTGNGHRAWLGIFARIGMRLDGVLHLSKERVWNLGKAQLKNFLETIDGKADLVCPVSDGLAVIETLERCYAQKKVLPVEKHPLGGFEGKTVFVTGGTGFIGGHLVEQLVLHEGANVRALVHNWGKAAYISRFDVEFVQGDILDEAAMEKAMAGCDYVFHLAIVGGAETSVKATESILGAAKKCCVKHVVQMSSVVVHGKDVPEDLNADSPLISYDDSYALSKYESEKRFWELLDEYELHGSVIRPTYVWGPYSMWYTIFPVMQMRKGDFVWLDNGNGICNAVYVGNVVDMCLLCCTNPKADHQAFIATDDEKLTWRDFYGQYMSVIGMTPEQFPSVPLKDSPGRKLGFAVKSSITKRMKYLMDKYQSLKGTSPQKAKWMYKAPRKALRLSLRPISKRLPEMDPVSRAIYDQKTVIDVRKNRELLGFKPRYSVEEGMKITCDWLRWSDLFKPKA